jgi:nitrite reductase/ring-hydroxylating ferredoxin subunit
LDADGWHRVDPVDVPAEGRVRSVTVDGRTVALARCGGRLGALENRCPHQGGPLGEGSIENGWLRCPWHGYDYDPLTGRPPEGFSDVADVLVETLRRFRPVRRRAHHCRQVRHPGQARAVRQPFSRQDRQRADRRRLPGLAHIPAARAAARRAGPRAPVELRNSRQFW